MDNLQVFEMWGRIVGIFDRMDWVLDDDTPMDLDKFTGEFLELSDAIVALNQLLFMQSSPDTPVDEITVTIPPVATRTATIVIDKEPGADG